MHRHHHRGDRHHHHNGADHHHPHDHNHAPPARKAAQWQTPHLPHADAAPEAPESDFDLVEAAFVRGFTSASDPISFLRLAQVPFEASDASGARLVLLRVESDEATDIGSLMPHVGGETYRYDPLPAARVERRRRLRFVYAEGRELRALTLAETRTLVPTS